MLDPALEKELDQLTEEIRPQARAEAFRAWQRAPHALDLEELHAEGLTGLAQARNRWETYCEGNSFSPYETRFFAAYCLRRIRGAILDAMRANDWVTRSARTRAKKVREAGGDRGLDEAELSEATGLSAQEIRDTAAAVAARPVSFDAEPHDVADHSEDVEGAAVVSSVLESVTQVMGGLDQVALQLVLLCHYEGLKLPKAAAVLGIDTGEARELYEEALLAVHDAMLKAVLLCPPA